HVRVVRTTAAFRRYPGDVLSRILDVTGLAVNTVLGVDLELLAAAVVFLHHFVYAGRAVTLCWLFVLRQVFFQRNFRVGQLQVNRLIFLMVGVGNEHRGQAVKRQLVIRLRIVDLLALRRRLQGGVVRSGVVEGDRQA